MTAKVYQPAGLHKCFPAVLNRRQAGPIQGGKRQETGALEKIRAPSRAGPPSRWWKRFWNLPVVTRLRGLRLRHASIQTCAKLTATRRNRLRANAALGWRTRL